jgi:hypothetical protein
MSRQLTNQLIADLNSRIPDNTTGQVTPAQMRSVLTDVIQSLRPAFATMWGNHNTTPKSVTLNSATWTIINATGMWPNFGLSDSTELDLSTTTGSFLVKFPGYVHGQSGKMSFIGPNGRVLQVSVGYNGIPVGPIATINCDGKDMSIADDLIWLPPENAQLQFLAKWATGASAAISISHVEVGAELMTTRIL